MERTAGGHWWLLVAAWPVGTMQRRGGGWLVVACGRVGSRAAARAQSPGPPAVCCGRGRQELPCGGRPMGGGT
eukprot:COSAG02_NODE_45074_length_360_cov_1.026820_1_plen_72_part_10